MNNPQKTERQDANDEIVDFVELNDETEEACNTCKTVVKMKLNQFIKNKRLQSRIHDVVMEANVLLGEGYLFANFHILRLLEAKKAVPKIDRNFYYRCLLAVQRKNLDVTTMGQDMMNSVDEFNSLRPVVEAQAPDTVSLYQRMNHTQLKIEAKARAVKRYSVVTATELRDTLIAQFGSSSPLTVKATDFKDECSKLLQF